ncbi:hypothetical protein BUALT_Bualt12G0047400 [Buddleja alternifolia]|uniref:Uncharacterized protein n=1 Tax=Buddleja alternifolia TaxID=168488 RepID=A0AAV6WZ95_9LAMI|nr:hypothetical protein BUALT_Bualt12G0047400 [Buddleja alternifolia]
MDGSIQESRLNKTAEPKSKYLKREIYEESKKIWKVALPGSISRVSSFGVLIVTRSFMGHISSADLAGYALVQSLSVRVANGSALIKNKITGPPQRLALPAPPGGAGPRATINNRVGGAGQGPVKAPFRRLTDSEREKQRRKGLCFRCKAPYHPTHDCPMKYLRVLLVEDDEAPLLELEEIEALPEEGGWLHRMMRNRWRW